MIALPESFGYWIGLAVLLFWFVGAYNRLVRLRSATLQAYAALDAALVRQLDFVQAQAVATLAAHADAAAHGAGGDRPQDGIPDDAQPRPPHDRPWPGGLCPSRPPRPSCRPSSPRRVCGRSILSAWQHSIPRCM